MLTLINPQSVSGPFAEWRSLVRVVGIGSVSLAMTVVTGCSSGSSGTPAASGLGPTASATLTVKTVDASVATPGAATVVVDGHTGQSLTAGDTVTTDKTGFAQVSYPDGSLARLGADTALTITSLSEADQAQRVTTTLSRGELWNNVKTVTSSQGRYQVDTRYADATVRDPQFIVGCALTSCTFAVYQGAVAVTASSGGPAVIVNAGQTLTATASGLGAVTTPPAAAFLTDRFLTRNLALDNPAATIPTATPTAAIPIASPTPVTALPASELKPFVGGWGAHDGNVVIKKNGTGSLGYVDFTKCPSCSHASAPVGTIAFVLTKFARGTVSGHVTASSDPRVFHVGEAINFRLMAASPGVYLSSSAGLFCNEVAGSAGECGA